MKPYKVKITYSYGKDKQFSKNYIKMVNKVVELGGVVNVDRWFDFKYLYTTSTVYLPDGADEKLLSLPEVVSVSPK